VHSKVISGSQRQDSGSAASSDFTPPQSKVNYRLSVSLLTTRYVELRVPVFPQVTATQEDTQRMEVTAAGRNPVCDEGEWQVHAADLALGTCDLAGRLSFSEPRQTLSLSLHWQKALDCHWA
jgi:hypothetical protein